MANYEEKSPHIGEIPFYLSPEAKASRTFCKENGLSSFQQGLLRAEEFIQIVNTGLFDADIDKQVTLDTPPTKILATMYQARDELLKRIPRNTGDPIFEATWGMVNSTRYGKDFKLSAFQNGLLGTAEKETIPFDEVLRDVVMEIHPPPRGCGLRTRAEYKASRQQPEQQPGPAPA